MSLIIIGGVILGTFMTLIVIPLLYYYLSRRGRKLKPLDKENGNVGVVD
jgi:predicted PurR-regulated permease PerM